MNNLEEEYPELKECTLCEWKCGVNRFKEKGKCGIGIPLVASSMLHPAPPASYDAFMVGCNFCCLGCQNHNIAMYGWAKIKYSIEGYYKPEDWAKIGVRALKSKAGRFIGADRLFFTGGEPTCSLPWIEKVVEYARNIEPDVKVNFDTNGFMTENSLKRILKFTTSITYDIKAFSEKTFKELTGAFVEPVLRNIRYILQNAKDKLWEIRVLAIPGIHEKEITPLASFLSEIEPEIPVNFLSFRPEFLMEDYRGATQKFLTWCVKEARKNGLKNVTWSGLTDIPGKVLPLETILKEKKCTNHSNRYCGKCKNFYDCRLRKS
ncbi:hypothetical protein DRQ09_02805 [candidate division KSB1 bacterium]|nr:MAG: hypothetical protein DRQ09_02805 [candidate division KSB1 bacterium]